MLNIGIIGTGSHSKTYHGMPALLLGNKINRCAVCSLDADEAASYAHQFEFQHSFSSIDKMLGSIELDALIAVTNVEANYSVAKQLIPYKIPLMTEKPPGKTSAETYELLELSKSCNTPVMVSFNRRFTPVLQKMRKAFNEISSQSGPALLRATMFRNNRTEKEFIHATSIHALDVIINFMGNPVDVQVTKIPAEANDLIATMIFANGSICEFTLLTNTGVTREEYEFFGEGFHLKADCINNKFESWLNNKMTDSFDCNSAPEVEKSGAIAETATYINSVKTGQPGEPGLLHGLQVMQLAEKLQQSI